MSEVLRCEHCERVLPTVRMAWTCANCSTSETKYRSRAFQLACVQETTIELVNFQSLTFATYPLSAPILIGASGQYVWAGEDLFCSGDYSYASGDGSSAYLLHWSEQWHVTELESMIDSRFLHGLWWFQAKDTVYAFGGRSHFNHRSKVNKGRSGSATEKCEKLSLRRNSWRALADMKEARSNFNPCEYHDYVYLCGQDSHLIEAFNPQNDAFLQLQTSFSQACACLLFIDNQQLVILSDNNTVTKPTAGREHELDQVSETLIEFGSCEGRIWHLSWMQ